MKSTKIVSTEFTAYVPDYCTETGCYKDKMPWDVPSMRNKPWFKCGCNGYEFNKVANFQSHIKADRHVRWLQNYHGDTTKAQIEELEKSIRELRVENGKLEQEKLRIMNKVKRRDVTIEARDKLITELEHKNKQLLNDGYWSCTSEEMD
tara:strand:- start:789 stop:1235 length:447 start_codon:yes stop_codon:yes gene_type:complete